MSLSVAHNVFNARQISTTNRIDHVYGAGVSVGINNNLYNTWTPLIATTSFDSYLCKICINRCYTSGACYPTLVDIAVGASGSEQTIIPDLLATGAADFTLGGKTFIFPIFIPAGSRISGNGRTSHVASTDPHVVVELFGRPSNLSAHRYGCKVQSFGALTATSTGTTATPGTSSDGSWTALGNTTRDIIHVNAAMGIRSTDSSWLDRSYALDLSYYNGATDKIVVSNMPIWVKADVERMGFTNRFNEGYQELRHSTSPQTSFRARLQSSGTSDATCVIAYGTY